MSCLHAALLRSMHALALPSRTHARYAARRAHAQHSCTTQRQRTCVVSPGVACRYFVPVLLALRQHAACTGPINCTPHKRLGRLGKSAGVAPSRSSSPPPASASQATVAPQPHAACDAPKPDCCYDSPPRPACSSSRSGSASRSNTSSARSPSRGTNPDTCGRAGGRAGGRLYSILVT